MTTTEAIANAVVILFAPLEGCQLLKFTCSSKSLIPTPFMAGLFSIPEGRTSLNILDPGAGSGILSVALLERLESNAEIDTIELVCYENDSDILGLLRSNLEWACSLTTKNVSFRIVTDNYILSQTLEYNHMLGASEASHD